MRRWFVWRSDAMQCIHFILKLRSILSFDPKVQFMTRLHICVYGKEYMTTFNIFQQF